jgi:hypothetical protein
MAAAMSKTVYLVALRIWKGATIAKIDVENFPGRTNENQKGTKLRQNIRSSNRGLKPKVP